MLSIVDSSSEESSKFMKCKNTFFMSLRFGLGVTLILLQSFIERIIHLLILANDAICKGGPLGVLSLKFHVVIKLLKQVLPVRFIKIVHFLLNAAFLIFFSEFVFTFRFSLISTGIYLYELPPIQ
jgi:hypothetical protein